MFTGVCCAAPETSKPDETTLRQLCNRGYARKRCPRFPDDSASDAVRFSVTEDTGDQVRVVYVIEKNHFPVEHGPIEYSLGQARFTGSHTSELLAAQARAYVESYLRKRVLLRES